MAEKCIELKGITKAFDGQIVLDHMNLDIHENEFVTLLGGGLGGLNHSIVIE